MAQKQICRLCLGQFSIGFSLLEKQNASMLESLTAIKVSEDDVTNLACPKCISKLKFAFTIQQTIIQANKKIEESTTNMASNTVLIKKETTEEIPEVVKIINPLEIKQDPLEITTSTDELSMSNIKICNNTCLICRKIFRQDKILKHIKEHFNQKQHCTACNETLTNITEYQKHVQQIHDIAESYKCTTCNVKFKYEPFYKIHLKSHNIEQLSFETSESSDNGSVKAQMEKLGLRSKAARQALEGSQPIMEKDTFCCTVCNKKFLTRRQFVCHSHQKGKCPICQAHISKSNLKKHILNHSSGPQVCELCGATLRSLESLRGHLSHTHSNKAFKCEECGKDFKKRYPYLLHKKKHAGVKTHICENCGKTFLTLYNLNKHIRMAHMKLRPHVCEYCKKAFSSRFALRTHVRQHTNETPYKCEFCGEGFRQNVSLRAHRKSKHNIIEPKTCACAVCGKEFGGEQAIISHMRLH